MSKSYAKISIGKSGEEGFDFSTFSYLGMNIEPDNDDFFHQILMIFFIYYVS